LGVGGTTFIVGGSGDVVVVGREVRIKGWGVVEEGTILGFGDDGGNVGGGGG